MKTRGTVLVLSVLAVVSAAWAEKQPRSRYDSVVERQMFGPLPDDFDPNKLPSEVKGSKKDSAAEKELAQQQEKLRSAIHFSVINVDPSGQTEVGFTDNSDPKTPRHYFLKVGETSQDGKWEVKEADKDTATMVIAQGEIEVSLSLGGRSDKDDKATTKAGANAAGARRSGSLLTGDDWKSRRAERRRKQAEADAAAAAKERAKEAERAQREAEREAQAAQEKAERDAEREQQRQQLLAIQEELKRTREEKAKANAEQDAKDDANAKDDAE